MSCLLTLSYLDVGWYDSYLAPEYVMHGIVTEKTDVFAFGVFLLELITGRQPIDEHRHSLVMWVSVLAEPLASISIMADIKLENELSIHLMSGFVCVYSILCNTLNYPQVIGNFPEYLIFFRKSLEFSLIIRRPRSIPENVLNTGYSG